MRLQLHDNSDGFLAEIKTDVCPRVGETVMIKPNREPSVILKVTAVHHFPGEDHVARIFCEDTKAARETMFNSPQHAGWWWGWHDESKRWYHIHIDSDDMSDGFPAGYRLWTPCKPPADPAP